MLSKLSKMSTKNFTVISKDTTKSPRNAQMVEMPKKVKMVKIQIISFQFKYRTHFDDLHVPVDLAVSVVRHAAVVAEIALRELPHLERGRGLVW